MRWRILFAACLLFSTSAAAVAPQRTFVASYGVDTSLTCSLAAPCRGFQAAINAVATGGEVVVLDSAGYGAMEIHKSVSIIVPPGVHAGLSPSTGIPLPGYPGQSGVVLIDIGVGDVVVLRGLNINHQGSLTGGIEWISSGGGVVHVENVVINGFPEAIYVQSPSGTLFIKDSVFRGNTIGIYGGQAGGGPVGEAGGIFADRVRIENADADAIRTLGGVTARVSNSELSSNNVAINIQAGTGQSWVYLDRCTVSGNNYVYVLGGASFNAHLNVAGSTIVSNFGQGTKTGAFAYVLSLGNNSLDNGTYFFDAATPPY